MRLGIDYICRHFVPIGMEELMIFHVISGHFAVEPDEEPGITKVSRNHPLGKEEERMYNFMLNHQNSCISV